MKRLFINNRPPLPLTIYHILALIRAHDFSPILDESNLGVHLIRLWPLRVKKSFERCNRLHMFEGDTQETLLYKPSCTLNIQ